MNRTPAVDKKGNKILVKNIIVGILVILMQKCVILKILFTYYYLYAFYKMFSVTNNHKLILIIRSSQPK